MASLSYDRRLKPARPGLLSSVEVGPVKKIGHFSPTEFNKELHLHALR